MERKRGEGRKKINERFELAVENYLGDKKKKKERKKRMIAREVSNRTPAVHLNIPTESSSYSNRAGGDDATSKGNTGLKAEA